jgi:hypothetical protein
VEVGIVSLIRQKQFANFYVQQEVIGREALRKKIKGSVRICREYRLADLP